MRQQFKPTNVNKPHRVKHSYTQSIKGTPGQIFPLLCPVREYDWIPGWKTDWVITRSGLAEPGCTFQTPPRPGEDGVASIWMITRHAAATCEVEMVKVTPGFTVGKLQFSMSPADDKLTLVTIAYEFTSLSARGDAFLDGFTAQSYEGLMQAWENEMNHFLKTGELLPETDM